MKQLVSYLLVGSLAALFNWSSRFLFSLWFGFSVAIVLAFIVGLSSGFILMRWLVFNRSSRAAVHQVPTYIVVNVFALLQTLVVSLTLAKWMLPAVGLRNPEGTAHLVGVLVPAFTSYFGHKYFTFK